MLRSELRSAFAALGLAVCGPGSLSANADVLSPSSRSYAVVLYGLRVRVLGAHTVASLSRHLKEYHTLPLAWSPVFKRAQASADEAGTYTVKNQLQSRLVEKRWLG